MNPPNMKYLVVLIVLFGFLACEKNEGDDPPPPLPVVDTLLLISPVDTILDPYGPWFRWEAIVPGPYRLQVYNYCDHNSFETELTGTEFRWESALVPGCKYYWKINTPDNNFERGYFTARNIAADMAGDFPVTIRYHTWGIAGPINFDTTYQGTFNLFNDNGVLWVTESTSNLNQDVYPVVQASDSLQIRYEMEQFSSLRFVYGKLYYHQDSIWFQFSQGGLAGGGIYEYRGKR